MKLRPKKGKRIDYILVIQDTGNSTSNKCKSKVEGIERISKVEVESRRHMIAYNWLARAKANLSVLFEAACQEIHFHQVPLHVPTTPLFSTTTRPAATGTCHITKLSQFNRQTRSEACSNLPVYLIRVDTSAY